MNDTVETSKKLLKASENSVRKGMHLYIPNKLTSI